MMEKFGQYLLHDLTIAKLHVYGFDLHLLTLIHCYLRERYQRVKINNIYSSYRLTKYGWAQGSLLGPFLLSYSFVIGSFFYNKSILQAMPMIALPTTLMKLKSAVSSNLKFA